jgi:hypothetical protein
MSGSIVPLEVFCSYADTDEVRFVCSKLSNQGTSSHAGRLHGQLLV